MPQLLTQQIRVETGIVPPPLGWPPGGMMGDPPDAIGAADLVPPGLRAPGTGSGFGVPVSYRPPGRCCNVLCYRRTLWLCNETALRC